MPVSLVLQRRGAYTNLDYVEGDVKLDLSSSENIENVVVKVEGKHLQPLLHETNSKGLVKLLSMLQNIRTDLDAGVTLGPKIDPLSKSTKFPSLSKRRIY
jgi:hypothetical protein